MLLKFLLKMKIGLYFSSVDSILFKTCSRINKILASKLIVSCSMFMKINCLIVQCLIVGFNIYYYKLLKYSELRYFSCINPFIPVVLKHRDTWPVVHDNLKPFTKYSERSLHNL